MPDSKMTTEWILTAFDEVSGYPRYATRATSELRAAIEQLARERDEAANDRRSAMCNLMEVQREVGITDTLFYRHASVLVTIDNLRVKLAASEEAREKAEGELKARTLSHPLDCNGIKSILDKAGEWKNRAEAAEARAEKAAEQLRAVIEEYGRAAIACQKEQG